jgi:hypothetical protein
MKLTDEEWSLIIDNLECRAYSPEALAIESDKLKALIEKIADRDARYWVAEKDERGKLKLIGKAPEGGSKQLGVETLDALRASLPEKNIVLVSMTLKEVEW